MNEFFLTPIPETVTNLFSCPIENTFNIVEKTYNFFIINGKKL